MPRAKKRIYLAAPLFSDAERSFNLFLKERLSPHVSVFLPQEDGRLLATLLREGVEIAKATRMVFEQDLQALTECHALIAVLDGRAVDEGVAFELGVSLALGKTRVGLQTDPRRLIGIANNPMIDGALEQVFYSSDALCDWICDWSRQPTS